MAFYEHAQPSCATLEQKEVSNSTEESFNNGELSNEEANEEYDNAHFLEVEEQAGWESLANNDMYLLFQLIITRLHIQDPQHAVEEMERFFDEVSRDSERIVELERLVEELQLSGDAIRAIVNRLSDGRQELSAEFSKIKQSLSITSTAVSSNEMLLSEIEEICKHVIVLHSNVAWAMQERDNAFSDLQIERGMNQRLEDESKGMEKLCYDNNKAVLEAREALTTVEGLDGLPAEMTIAELFENLVSLFLSSEKQLNEAKVQVGNLAAECATLTFEKREYSSIQEEVTEFRKFMFNIIGEEDLGVIEAHIVAQNQTLDELYRKNEGFSAAVEQSKQEKMLLHAQIELLENNVAEMEQQHVTDEQLFKERSELVSEEAAKLVAMEEQRDAVIHDAMKLEHNDDDLKEQVALTQAQIITKDEAIHEHLEEITDENAELTKIKKELLQTKEELEACRQQYEAMKEENVELETDRSDFIAELNTVDWGCLYDASEGLVPIGRSLVTKFQECPKLITELELENIKIRKLSDERCKQIADLQTSLQETESQIGDICLAMGDEQQRIGFTTLVTRVEKLVSNCNSLTNELQLAQKQIDELSFTTNVTARENTRLETDNDEKDQLIHELKDDTIRLEQCLNDADAKIVELGNKLTVSNEHFEAMRLENEDALSQSEFLATEMAQSEKSMVNAEKEQEVLESVSLNLREHLTQTEETVHSLTRQLAESRQRAEELHEEKIRFVATANDKFQLATIFGAEDTLDEISEVITLVLESKPSELPNLQKNYSDVSQVNRNLVEELSKAERTIQTADNIFEGIATALELDVSPGELEHDLVERVKELVSMLIEFKNEYKKVNEQKTRCDVLIAAQETELEVERRENNVLEMKISELQENLKEQTDQTIILESDREKDQQMLKYYVEELEEVKEAASNVETANQSIVGELKALKAKDAGKTELLNQSEIEYQELEQEYDCASEELKVALPELESSNELIHSLTHEKASFVFRINAEFGLGCIFGPKDPLSDIADAISRQILQRPAELLTLERDHADQALVNKELTGEMQKLRRRLLDYDELWSEIAHCTGFSEDIDNRHLAIERVKRLYTEFESTEEQHKLLKEENITLKAKMADINCALEISTSELEEARENLVKMQTNLKNCQNDLQIARVEKTTDQEILREMQEKLELGLAINATEKIAEDEATTLLEKLEYAEEENVILRNRINGIEEKTAIIIQQCTNMETNKVQFTQSIGAILQIPIEVDNVFQVVLKHIENTAGKALPTNDKSVARENSNERNPLNTELIGEELEEQHKTNFGIGILSSANQPNSLELSPVWGAKLPTKALAAKLLEVLGGMRELANQIKYLRQTFLASLFADKISIAIDEWHKYSSLVVNDRISETASFGNELAEFRKQLFAEQKIVMRELQQLGIFYSGGDTIELIYFLLGEVVGQHKDYAPVPEVINEIRRLEAENKELCNMVQLLEIKLRQSKQE